MFSLREQSSGLLPPALAENYKNADGAAVKVALLFLERKTADIADICRVLQMDRQSVDKAVDFWLKTGLISENCGQSPAAQPYTLERMAKATLKNPEISQIFSEAQRILGRPTSHSENIKLAELYEVGGFSAEYILFVLEYSREFATGGKEVAYAERVAGDWKKAGIVNLAAAEGYLKSIELQDKMVGDVISALNLSEHKANKRERSMIISWYEKFGYDATFAAEAAKQAGNSDIPYINSILQSWNEKGYKTLRQTRSRLSNSPAGNRKATKKDDLFNSVMSQYKENK